MDMRKIKNARWFFKPTQLLIQGQWWSNRSTHLLQVAQWRERGVRMVKHYAHSYVLSIASTMYMKFPFFGFLRKPGSLHEAKARDVKQVMTKARFTAMPSYLINLNVVDNSIATTTKKRKSYRMRFLELRLLLVGGVKPIHSIFEGGPRSFLASDLKKSVFTVSSLTKSMGILPSLS